MKRSIECAEILCDMNSLEWKLMLDNHCRDEVKTEGKKNLVLRKDNENIVEEDGQY